MHRGENNRGGAKDKQRPGYDEGARLSLLNWRKAAAKTIFGDYAREEKILQIFAPACFGPATAHFKTAKWLPLHDCARDWAIDVKVAANNFAPGALDIQRAARINSAGQGKLAIVGQGHRFIEV